MDAEGHVREQLRARVRPERLREDEVFLAPLERAALPAGHHRHRLPEHDERVIGSCGRHVPRVSLGVLRRGEFRPHLGDEVKAPLVGGNVRWVAGHLGGAAGDLGVSTGDSQRRIRGKAPVDGARCAIRVEHGGGVPAPAEPRITRAESPIGVWPRRSRKERPSGVVHVEGPHGIRRVPHATRGDELVVAVDVEAAVDQDLVVVPDTRGTESRRHVGNGNLFVNIRHGNGGILSGAVRYRHLAHGVGLQGALAVGAGVVVPVRVDEGADEIAGRDEPFILDGHRPRHPVVAKSGWVIGHVVHRIVYGERRAGAAVVHRTAEHAHVTIRHGHDARPEPALVIVPLLRETHVGVPALDELPLKRGPHDHLRGDLKLETLRRVVPRCLVAVTRAVGARPEHADDVSVPRYDILGGLKVKPGYVVVVVSPPRSIANTEG